MTREQLIKDLEWTDKLREMGVMSDLSDFYWQSRKLAIVGAYDMSKQPISFEDAKKQVEESLRVA